MKEYSFDNLVSVATDDEQKEHMLNMLVAFDKFCKEHGLRYYLSGGTLLGAIRHKGFIPWDDDVDVNMPRPDCEKLMELSGGYIGGYELMEPNYTTRYHAYHWKLFDESMLVGKRKRGELAEKVYPVFMDIFPIEGLPDTEAANEEHYKIIRSKKNKANYVWYSELNKYKGRNPLKKIKRQLMIDKAKKTGIKALFDEVIAFAKTIPYDESDYIGVMMTNVHTTEERVKKSEYEPQIEVDFEGKKFCAPAGYDTYLRQLYGDKYMEWLPVHQRISRHALIPFHSNCKEG